ncbi:MAG: hypothetical protein K2W93_08930 [Burkholderiaceae bacterium]|nr:hypothetical protein [Burkholderiaceae bacterium]
MSGRITISRGRKGISVRASGSSAQALFDALTKGQDKPVAAPAEPLPAPTQPTPKTQIGPLDV